MCNKTVFITGAAKNTGYAIAKRFASEGYQVAISSRDQQAAENAAAEISALYDVKAKGYALNLQDVPDIRRVFADIKTTFGGLAAFVPNAANHGIGQEFLDVTEKEFDNLIGVNIRGNYFCCQEAARLMKGIGGSITFMGSVHYRAAIWGRSLYAASKGAIAALVRSMAVELAEYGIRVNQVVPGAIRTDRWNDLTEKQVKERRRNWPAGVESTGEDIANAVYFMASDQAHTITGTDLVIDSGVLACLLAYNGGKH